MKLTKPYPVNDREQTIAVATAAFPEAENVLVAVDLLAQDVYKHIRANEGIKSVLQQYDEIEFYGYLQGLRMQLNNEFLHNYSSFKLIERKAVNG